MGAIQSNGQKDLGEKERARPRAQRQLHYCGGVDLACALSQSGRFCARGRVMPLGFARIEQCEVLLPKGDRENSRMLQGVLPKCEERKNKLRTGSEHHGIRPKQNIPRCCGRGRPRSGVWATRPESVG